MYNYVDIKVQETELFSRQEGLKKDWDDTIARIYDLKQLYPESFGTLPSDYEKYTSENIISRLNYLIEDIELSNIEGKESIVELVKNCQERLSVISENQKANDKYLEETLEPAKKERREYLQEKLEEGRKYKEELDYRKGRIAQLQKNRELLSSDEKLDKTVLEAIDAQIKEHQNICDELREKMHDILSEEGIDEEFKLIIEEEEKEKTQEEDLENNKTVSEELESENKTGEVSKPEETNTEEEKDPEKKEAEGEEKEPEEEKDEIEPIREEKPKKVKRKHKAQEKLIEKIKKYGGKGLGLTAILAAVALFLTNPKFLVERLAAGLVLEKTTGPKK